MSEIIHILAQNNNHIDMESKSELSFEQEERVKALRKTRDDYNSKAAECQKEIDDIYINALDAVKFNNKTVAYDDGSTMTYIRVNEVKRLNYGIRLYGNETRFDKDEDTGEIMFSYYENVDVQIHKPDIPRLVIVDDDLPKKKILELIEQSKL